MKYAIEVRSVTKRFGRRLVLDKFSLSIAAGACVTLCGPSGCGKTTLLRLIAGLETPDEGAVAIVEMNGGTRPPYDGTIGMVFQDLALWPHMRAARHLGFVLRGRGLARWERRGRIHELLTLTGLDAVARSYPAQMSGGEQQRLAIARALATEPRLLLLDEPFANLDAVLRERLTCELARRKEAGVTLVIATHDPEETRALSNHRVNLGR